MSDATRRPRRGFLAGLTASVATPAAGSDGTEDEGTTPESEPASVLPDYSVDTQSMVLPNPVRNDFELFFVSGPRGPMATSWSKSG